MIKKYFEFSESHNSLGEYIEELSENDEFIRMIVGDYTKEIDSSIRISNAVNVLDDFSKIELLRRVESHLNNEIGDVDVTASSDVESMDESYGKNVFSTFLKCITALGIKDISPTKNTPDDFIIMFKLDDLDYLRVESTFNRFKSLSSLGIEYSPDIALYIGIKNQLLEYGYVLKSKLNPIGVFKLNNRNLNWIKNSNLKSLSGIKKSLSNMSSSDIKMMCIIKKEVLKFSPKYTNDVMLPIVNDGIITFGYHGVGNWSNGVLLDQDLIDFKETFKSYLSNFRWSNKVLVNVTPNKFWIVVKIKIK